MSEHKFRWCNPKYSMDYRWIFSTYYYTKEEQISLAEEAILKFPELVEYFQYLPPPVPGGYVTKQGYEIYKRKMPEIQKKAKSGEEFIKLMNDLLLSLPVNHEILC